MSEAIGGKERIIRIARSALCRKMKQAAKIIVCLVLCLALVWGYSYKEPMTAHAEAVTATVIGVVAVSAALTALGICVAAAVSTGDYNNICQKIWDKTSENVRNQVTAAAVAGGALYKLTTDFLSTVGNQIKTAYDAATAQSPLSAIPKDKLKSDSCNIIASYLFRDVLGMQYLLVAGGNSWCCISDTVISYSILGVLSIPTTNDWVTIGPYGDNMVSFKKFSTWGQGYPYKINDGYEHYLDFSCMSSTTFGYVVALRYKDSPEKIVYYLVSTAQASTSGASNAYNVFGLGTETSTAAIPSAPGRDVYGTDCDKWYADGASALNNPVDDVVGRVGDAVGVNQGDGSVSIPIPIPQTGLQTGDQSRTQENTLGKDISTTQDKEKNEKTNKDKDTSKPKPPGLPDLSLPLNISKKFPFCIPFDVYMIVSGFYCAEAKAPKWTIPVVNQRMGWKWQIDIDFSQFESLAVLCRWFNGALWVFGLILVTRKLIGAGGGD